MGRFRPKAPSRGLVLYGIRELAKHHYELLGNDLDIEWTTLLNISSNATTVGIN